jgi:hypothetical protein
MEVVADQFAQLKSAIDTQAAIQQTHIPISTSIVLGNKEIPFLMSVRSFGSLDILSDTCRMVVKTKLGSTDFNKSLGTIKYESLNAYYLQQTYIYEAGAVILSQYQGNIMSIKPTFSVDKEKNVTISFTIINISKIVGKTSSSGYGTIPIQTDFLNINNLPTIMNVTNISIFTNYQNAWYNFINGTLIKAGLNYNGYGTNYTINISKEDRLLVEFKPVVTVHLNIKLIEVEAQIAPGWIENTKS